MDIQHREITVFNDSNLDGAKAIVFQKDADLPLDMLSLAWFSSTCHPRGQVRFPWTTEYDFVWGQAGTLAPGVNYLAAQVVGAELYNNAVTLTYRNGGFEFTAMSRNTEGRGSLSINEDASVPGAESPDRGAVGVGMSGFATFVRPTQPDAGLQYTPNPSYYVALGLFRAGDVVAESQLYSPTQVTFNGSSTATCVYSNSGYFDITYSS
ncbi:hypothetical protein [Frankia sp. QA3]|uniref:hypothetical protein n=1 Tax=Frankia sp. QA3 TaxID=710111 RepID=UPI000269C0C1|nr:hypothetical protein [Frankia sp. QA3]EIV91600.1 hypothetical protein FraQA3DRAFT_1062 [Frankia sp. QA3]